LPGRARHLRLAQCDGEHDAAAGFAKRRRLRCRLFDQFPNLLQRRKSPGTKLSGGEQQMLAIARILRTGSRFLLLDEPSEGLAPVVVKQIGALILNLKKQGFTILLVEQNLKFARSVADRFVVVEHGEVVDRLAASELAANMGRVQTYLGV
jgi:branched-chain amino acid transport system ATP-binding protein